MIIEKSFPRGGVPAKESKKPVSKKDKVIFGALQTKFKKAKPAKTIIEPEDLLEEEQNDVIESHSAELLNYETIQDGMLIMGVVTAVDQLFITVSLPGRMVTRISALDISDSYTKAAKDFLENTNNANNYKTLEDLYKVGQLIYGRVQEVKQHNEFSKKEILMTLKPTEVHADLVHTKLPKGFIFNGAIAEIQEHGFIVESGIKGLRAFLPLEKSKGDLSRGQLVFLKIDKITIDATASTCVCKQLQPDQLKVKSIQSGANIDYILPSSIVNFQVTKCLKDGLQGTIMNESFTAYVNEHQLGEPLMLPEDYEINSKHNARVLYVMPMTKFVYLTLNLNRGITPTPTEKSNEEEIKQFKRGDIIDDARVHHIGTGGVVLVLKNQLKGLISYKTIKANYKGNYDQDELLNKYSKKSKHKVRVLDYDLMDTLYICSDDPKIVEEKYFSIDDLKPGDFTTATVKSVNKEISGYNVAIGKIKGIIEGIYLMPGHKPYESDAKIHCRVIDLNLDRNKVYLTNRAEYMAKNCKILSNIDSAKKNSIYMGTIVKTTNEFYVVKFFNGITGLLFKNQLGDVFLKNQIIDLTEGQTMPFRIISRNGTKLTLGLVEDVSELGEIYSATVTHVLQAGLEINVDTIAEEDDDDTSKSIEQSIKGIVPIRLLSDFLDLLEAKLRIYDINTKLETVSIHKNVFSVRDVAYFQENDVKNWKTVAPGDILRAFIENINDEVIEIFVPIRGYEKLVKIHINMLLLQAYNVPNIEFHPEQVIFVKVVGKEEATKTISVTAKLTSVWDQRLDTTACYVERYLLEVAEIQQALKKKNAPISNFSIGDKINVEFLGVDAETLEWHYQEKKSKIYAIARPSILSGTKLKVPADNNNHEAIILWIDYSKQILYISPNPADIKHISKSTNLPEEFSNAQKVNAKVLIKLNHIFICSLKKGPNPLVFCPIKLHYNDFENSASTEVKEGDFCKLAFIHKTKPIAVLQQTWSVWQNGANKKRKTSINEDEVIGSHTKQKKLDNEIKAQDKNDSEIKKKEKRKTEKQIQAQERKKKIDKQIKAQEKKDAEIKKAKLAANEIIQAGAYFGDKKPQKMEEKKKTTDKQIKAQEKKDAEIKKAKLAANEIIQAGVYFGNTKPQKMEEEDKTIDRQIKAQETKSTEIKKSKRSANELSSETAAKKSKTNVETKEMTMKPKDPDELALLPSNAIYFEDTKPQIIEEKIAIPKPPKSLSGVTDFWTTDLDQLTVNKFYSSSDDDDDNDEHSATNDLNKQKKKKLSSVEKFKQQREEEARLREIENKYADPNHLPETIDQFDRLVLSDPNNSKNWINYMVFHLQSAEIDKARAVARRAIKAISMRNPEDHLNIWVALLNLEIRYGCRETFDCTLKEALTFNEPIKVYLRVVEILREANKQQELIELIGILTKKFKGEQDAWKAAAEAYFSIGMTEKAQQMLHKSVASLPEREHVNTIVLFANLNHRYGCNEMAHTLLDQIVTSYPKRVDVWSQYVDMLVKDQLIDSARSVLERAIIQKIPIKKMRTIFKKYLEFEERHGTESDVEKVKRLAAEYVKQNANFEI